MSPNRQFTYSTTIFFLLTIFVSITFPSFFLPKATAQIYPEISFSPQTAFATPGETFNISVTLSNVRNLYLYQVQFKFSKEILEVTDIIQGSFMGRGTFVTFWQPKPDNTKGEVKVWEAMLPPDPPVAGTGELFKVTFLVKKSGSCALNFFETQLFNQFQGSLPHTSENGKFTTTKLSITPDVVKGAEYVPEVSFNVSVTLEGTIENLYGFNLTITYDKAVLNATSATLIPLLATPNTNLTEIDFNEGTVWLNVTCKQPALSTNETGPIATITFKILTVGNTDINITKYSFVNTEGKPFILLVGKASFSGVLRDIGIVEVTLSPLVVVVGENITAMVKIQNYGGITETFNFMVYARQNNIAAIVAGPSEFSVAGLSNMTIPMNLTTNGLEGNYTISIFISYVPDETDIQNNEYTYPTPITINPKGKGLIIPLEMIAYVAIAVVLIIAIIAAYFKLKRKP